MTRKMIVAWLVATITAAVGAAVGAAAEVPWVDRAAPPYEPVNWPPSAPAPPAPACTATAVVPSFVGYVALAGIHGLRYRLTNVRNAACRLEGDPFITATTDGMEPVRALRGRLPMPEAGSAATIDPGDSATLQLLVQPSCQNDRWLAAGKVATEARLVLTLPDGDVDLPVPDDSAPVFAPDGACPFGTTGFEHWASRTRADPRRRPAR